MEIRNFGAKHYTVLNSAEESGCMETFFAIEPKAVVYVLINALLWIGIGYLLYKLIRWKKKKDYNPD